MREAKNDKKRHELDEVPQKKKKIRRLIKDSGQVGILHYIDLHRI